MSLLAKIETSSLGEGIHRVQPPERVVEGGPEITVWTQDESQGGRVRCGVADATVGTTRSFKGGDCEIVHLIEGIVALTEEGGGTQTFRTGDIFVMKPGFTGVWKIVEKVRKVIVFVSGDR